MSQKHHRPSTSICSRQLIASHLEDKHSSSLEKTEEILDREEGRFTLTSNIRFGVYGEQNSEIFFQQQNSIKSGGIDEAEKIFKCHKHPGIKQSRGFSFGRQGGFISSSTERYWDRSKEMNEQTKELLAKGSDIFETSIAEREELKQEVVEEWKGLVSSREYNELVYSMDPSQQNVLCYRKGKSELDSERQVRQLFSERKEDILQCATEIKKVGCEKAKEMESCRTIGQPYQEHWIDTMWNESNDITKICLIMLSLFVLRRAFDVFHEAYYKITHGRCHAFCGIEEVDFKIVLLSIFLSTRKIPKDDLDVIKAMADNYSRSSIAGEHNKKKAYKSILMTYKALYKVKEKIFMKSFRISAEAIAKHEEDGVSKADAISKQQKEEGEFFYQLNRMGIDALAKV